MSAESYRGVLRGGTVVVLEGSVPLADGTYVLVTPMPLQPGSGPAIVQAMAALPPVPKEWVDELERLIREGERPPSREVPFEDEVRESP